MKCLVNGCERRAKYRVSHCGIDPRIGYVCDFHLLREVRIVMDLHGMAISRLLIPEDEQAAEVLR